jgi:hypothetical protein
MKWERGRDFESQAREMGDYGEMLRETIEPDVVIDVSALSASFPENRGRYEGHTGWVEFWSDWLGPWKGFEFDAGDFEPRGEHVVVETLMRARGHESEVPVQWDVFQVWTFRDGKIVGLASFDTRDEALAFAAAD